MQISHHCTSCLTLYLQVADSTNLCLYLSSSRSFALIWNEHSAARLVVQQQIRILCLTNVEYGFGKLGDTETPETRSKRSMSHLLMFLPFKGKYNQNDAYGLLIVGISIATRMFVVSIAWSYGIFLVALKDSFPDSHFLELGMSLR